MQIRAEQNKKLLKAAKNGDVAEINAALAAGADIDARKDDCKDTPLILAAAEGNTDAVSLLLAKGANTLLADKYNTTALFTAARWEHAGTLAVIVNHLLEKYKNSPKELLAHLKNDNTRSLLAQDFSKNYSIAAPIMKAISFLRANKCSEKEISKLLPINYVMPKKKSNPAETEKLVDAASKNDLAGVIPALDAGADIDASTAKHGGNALHVASMNGFTTVMAELLKRGADVYVRSDLGTKKGVNGATPLIWAAQKAENRDAVELLLTAKAEINAARNDGITALHYAAFHNHHEVCELLLTHGADPTVIDSLKCTPLLYAVQQGNNFPIKFLVKNLLTAHTGNHKELLRFLRKNREFNKLIESATSRAASLELMKLIDFLLENNTSYAEINPLFPETYTFKNTKLKEDIVMHLQSLPAAKRLTMCNSILTEPTHPYRVILSMQRGTQPCKLGHGILKQVAGIKTATELSIKKVNQPDLNNDNATPLYTAAMNGDMAKVKQLIQEGADCASTAYTGGILFGAAQSGDIDIINLLVENGADPKLTKHSVKQIFSRAFSTQNKDVKARLKSYFNHFPTNAIEVTPADIAEIFGHTEAAGLLRILADQDPVIEPEQAPTLAATVAPAQPPAPAAAPPAPVATLYPTIVPAVQQEPSVHDAHMSTRKNISPAEAPAAVQKVALTKAVVATPAAVIKPVAPLQPTVVSTLSIFTPGKAIELAFDSPNPEINVPVLQPQKIAPSDVTSSYALRNSLFSLDEPVTAAQPTFPSWAQELDTPSSRTTSENESLALQQLEALEPALTHTYATEHKPITMVSN